MNFPNESFIYILSLLLIILSQKVISMNLELKIVDLLARNHEKGFTINEVAKELKQFYSFANRVVNRLAKDKVINITKIGRAHQCTLNLNSEKTRALIVLAEIEKKEELYGANKRLKLILEDFISSAKGLKNNVLTIVLFGSYAKGTAAEKSDIDILIIVKKHFPTEKITREIYAKYSAEISPILLTEKEFREQKNKEVIKEIIKNHCVLLGAENFIKLAV